MICDSVRMAEITSPTDTLREVATVAEYLEAVKSWDSKYNTKDEKYLSGVWYRGNGQEHPSPLRPGVYREEFSKRAKKFYGKDGEEKRLNLEREMLQEFRTLGAAFFDANNIREVYFIAQHYGMPTRLLDWTANPLAALFFSVENEQHHSDNGEVFIMEAKGILPEKAKPDEYPPNVVTMRHPHVQDAIRESFWGSTNKKRLIIPVRPDNEPGRIGLRSSCFTLHMHKSGTCTNPTLAKIPIPAKEKAALLKELHRLNINQFTIYNDLDHLSKDIKRVWLND
jgi:hypothetical protein